MQSDDGQMTYSCTEDDRLLQEWIAAGNTPEPADASAPSV